MTDPSNQPPGPPADGPAAFPPQEISAFLRFCAGEWMALRSRFALAEAAVVAEGDEWHSSERGELVVAYLEPGGAECPVDSPGGLSVGPKGEPARRLLFAANGNFQVGEQRGSWQLWPDGSLELVMASNGSELRERIWFTKPNLRLRSTVENHADGSPGRASFSSEIRRVSRPAS
ncbi:MAG: phycobiliprotein lyase [Cyanobacteriota bacterium]|jgi:hypothetical protein